jgi:hypothetical protein
MLQKLIVFEATIAAIADSLIAAIGYRFDGEKI